MVLYEWTSSQSIRQGTLGANTISVRSAWRTVGETNPTSDTALDLCKDHVVSLNFRHGGLQRDPKGEACIVRPCDRVDAYTGSVVTLVRTASSCARVDEPRDPRSRSNADTDEEGAVIGRVRTARLGVCRGRYAREVSGAVREEVPDGRGGDRGQEERHASSGFSGVQVAGTG